MNNRVGQLCLGAMIASLYVVFTYIAALFNLSGNSLIQVRISEALCVLPVFTPAAIPGLTIGCLLANVLTGGSLAILDVILGTVATFIGAVGTYILRKTKYVFVLPPIISNSLIIPIVLEYVYNIANGFWILVLSVFVGEFVSVGILGFLLKVLISKKISYFRNQIL